MATRFFRKKLHWLHARLDECDVLAFYRCELTIHVLLAAFIPRLAIEMPLQVWLGKRETVTSVDFIQHHLFPPRRLMLQIIGRKRALRSFGILAGEVPGLAIGSALIFRDG